MGKNIANTTHNFLFCDGGSCQKAGSEEVVRKVRAYLRNNGLWDSTHTIKTRCNGRCEDAPTWIVQPNNYWYKELTPEKGLEIIKSHIHNNEPVEKHLLYQNKWDKVASEKEIPAYKLKPFSILEDTTLGSCYLTRGFASDQYTFPLFLYLKEHSPTSKLILDDNKSILFSDIKEVIYSKQYVLELILEQETIELVIAPINQKDEALVKARISIVEYFHQITTNKKGIRFKNKFGHQLGLIWLSDTAWEYCSKVQLQGLTIEKQPV
ncbi:(2Fe-2S) ferredoxin domain-containing protein [Flammeovirga kamogawensis]|uniref:(2Fe-2S) ferredoxin domain-containing protein n=1 Tax=Flammeovirga kamogawensis TaxID=373891 RepID=A0ABX8H3A4_9BACT|nr:(2Fe-2S) ferredoxin domain-containing protein [Flammeovirga kamogawensis]MBB6460335.1 (2Fe-2S) ferredoxin [Flammeovirga kamogawensis]QWG10144.1 (2Fe-2S) ferredoxin domain-containing protein [Flammeovirga kamogawensis]TRX65652.1 (2Fe-2S) ferredoxin domain-containing protein [Flammeovirga kamogawensis]